MDSINQQVDDVKKIVLTAMNKGLKKSVRFVKKETKEINKSAVNKLVYKTYTPKYYQRRKTLNGLQDNKNVIFDNPIFSENGWSVSYELEFHNITRPNPIKYNKYGSHIDVKHKEFYNNYFLASMIDQGYGKKNKPYNKPRPFLNSIKERIEDNGYATFKIKELISEELVKVGIKIK